MDPPTAAGNGAEDPPSESIRLLHVDDDEAFLELSRDVLSRKPTRFQVVTASCGAEAIDRLGGAAGGDAGFDCIVSDYQMPEMDGLELLAEVRAAYPELPFILFTGRGSEEVASEAISAGATDYLQKQGGLEHFELLANRVVNAVESYRAVNQTRDLDRVQGLVREINQALVRGTTREEIESAICEILAGADPYTLAWIGRVDSSTNEIIPNTVTGDHEHYADEIELTTEDRPTGRGPAGRAVQSGSIAFAQDIRNTPSFAPWRESALEHGLRSAAAIPLSYRETNYGVLALYADRPGAFDERERAILSELGEDIAHALHARETRRELEQTTARLESLFEHSPNMIDVHDAEGHILDVNQRLCDKLGYAKDELVGKRVWDIDVSTDRERVLETLKSLTVGDRLEVDGRYERADGVRFPVEVHLRRLDVEGEDRFMVISRDVSRRERKEAELREQKQRFHRLAENLQEVVWMSDPAKDEMFYVNPAYERVWGRSTESLYENPESFVEAVHPADRDRVRAAIEEQSTGTYREEYRVVQPDGEVRWVEDKAVPVTDAAGNVDRIVGIATDVTERVQRERRLETLISNLPGIVYRCRHEAGWPLERVNGECEALTGYSAAELERGDVSWGEDLILAEDRDRVWEEVTEQLASKGSFELTYRIRTSDGEVRWMWERGRRIESADRTDDRTYLEGFITDVTERMERREELERYETIVQALGDPVYALDGNARYTFVNDAMVGVSGYDREEILGSHISLMFSEENVERSRAIVEELLETEDATPTTTFETERVTADGETIPSEVHVGLLPGEDGDFRGTAGVARDISDRLARERELERQNERLQEFTAIVSHDLRNPLNLAMGHLELAADECDSRHLDDAASGIDRMEALIDDLLTLAQKGDAVTDTEPVSLQRVAAGVAGGVGLAMDRLEVEPSLTIEADESRLKQLLHNLFQNALDHGGERVTIEVGPLADGAGFYVEDDGPGLPEDDPERILESGVSSTANGLGYGLTVVRRMAEAHGWEMAVSNGERGARFEFSAVELSNVADGGNEAA